MPPPTLVSSCSFYPIVIVLYPRRFLCPLSSPSNALPWAWPWQFPLPRTPLLTAPWLSFSSFSLSSWQHVFRGAFLFYPFGCSTYLILSSSFTLLFNFLQSIYLNTSHLFSKLPPFFSSSSSPFFLPPCLPPFLHFSCSLFSSFSYYDLICT